MRKVVRWIFLGALIIGLIAFFIFDFDRVLTFAWFKKHHLQIQNFIEMHFLFALLSALLVYILIVALSVPGATLLTITIGYLFGMLLGCGIVLIAATIGSACLFFIVRSTLGEWLRKKAIGWIEQLRVGFSQNAFNYLLFLRLVPLVPFWVLNIVPALLGMSFISFVVATFLGIIPGTLIYLSLGQSLDIVLARDIEPNISVIFEPMIFLPLLALGVLALVPMFIKRIKKIF